MSRSLCCSLAHKQPVSVAKLLNFSCGAIRAFEITCGAHDLYRARRPCIGPKKIGISAANSVSSMKSLLPAGYNKNLPLELLMIRVVYLESLSKLLGARHLLN